MRQPLSLFPSEPDLPLITDLYELTMAAGYHARGMGGRACFEAYVRALPQNRSFLVAAGLEQALHLMLTLRFGEDAVEHLRSLPVFSHVPGSFFDALRAMRFTGDVWAIPEGTVVFPGEPLLRVEADLIEAQILETYLLTCLNLQTLVASKAARICTAAEGRPVVDFGARRAHGPQAGLLAARASIIGGCTGTSNVQAARLLGVPAVGTMAHSWIMAFDSEADAFRAFAESFPDNAICLIDTYDTVRGAEIAARTLGPRLKGVRLDSGDLLHLSRQVRRVLDDLGCGHAKIVVSSDLNEFTIRDLLAAGAPIDMFGVGTDMVTSKDAPALSVVYKLVAVQEESGGWRSVVKRSESKATYGGRKQVWRRRAADGRFAGDRLALADERCEGEPLLQPFIREGRLVAPLPSLPEIARHARAQIESLPASLQSLRGRGAYPVQLSDGLQAAQPPPG